MRKRNQKKKTHLLSGLNINPQSQMYIAAVKAATKGNKTKNIILDFASVITDAISHIHLAAVTTAAKKTASKYLASPVFASFF